MLRVGAFRLLGRFRLGYVGSFVIAVTSILMRRRANL